jgi:predicted ATP-grasp superfamily ATP-dependent carboligase
VGLAGAIIIGGYINGLGVVRALAARGIPIGVITTQPYDIAQRSRWVVAHDAVHALHQQPERLVDLLERRAPQWSGWALFPTNDEAMSVLAQHRERLARTYRIVLPPNDVVADILDKQRMLDLARAVGIEVPHCYGPATAATAERADVRFPVVVKPVVSYSFAARFGCKLFVAHDRAELRRCVARVGEVGIAAQVHDLIPGADSQFYAYCTYVDAGGEPCAGVTVRKLRQSPPFFGVARVAEIAAEIAVLRESTLALLRHIGFRGMAVAEFKLDARDGRFRFIEVNGRSVIYNGLLWRAGLDLAGLAWADCVDRQPQRSQPNGWPGAWINLHADVLYSLLYRRQDPVRFADFLAPYGRPMMEAVWSARDPLPFFTQWSRTARAGAAALRDRTHRTLLADRTRPPELTTEAQRHGDPVD